MNEKELAEFGEAMNRLETHYPTETVELWARKSLPEKWSFAALVGVGGTNFYGHGNTPGDAVSDLILSYPTSDAARSQAAGEFRAKAAEFSRKARELEAANV